MTSGTIFGTLFLVIGAVQLWTAYRTPTPRRADMMLMGAGLAALGISRILEHSHPALRIGSTAVSAIVWIVYAWRLRRESPRTFVVITSLMILSVVLIVLDTFVDLDSALRPVARPLFWIFMAALLAGGLWAIVTVVRAIRAPFRPITPRDD